MKTVAQIETAGASKSLKKSISDLENFLALRMIPNAPNDLRVEYNEKLTEVLRDIAERWYRKGFRRAHKILYRKHSVPKKLGENMTITGSYMPKKGLKVHLRSRI
jgi:hypothetical protein